MEIAHSCIQVTEGEYGSRTRVVTSNYEKDLL